MSVQACVQFVKKCAASASLLLFSAVVAMAQQAPAPEGGEANLTLPDLSQVNFLGVDGHKLLLFGILFCVFGLAFQVARDRKSTRLNSSHVEISYAVFCLKKKKKKNKP